MTDGWRGWLKEWVVPPGVLRLRRRRSLMPAMRPTHAEEALLAPNATLNGAYAGRRCFVVCNGPSLAKQDLLPLRDEVTITMNWFNRHPVLAHWKPTFHCAAEPAEGLNPELVASMLKGLDAKGYFFQIETRDHFSHPSLREYANVHYVRSRWPAAEWMDFGVPLDLAATIPAAGETSQLAVLVALALGCSPIYLLGADQDWLSHRSIYQHFYPDEEAHASEDMALVPYDDAMRSALQVWTSHRALRKLAERRGQTILNATEGGFMDVYPLTTLAAALESSPPPAPGSGQSSSTTDAD